MQTRAAILGTRFLFSERRMSPDLQIGIQVRNGVPLEHPASIQASSFPILRQSLGDFLACSTVYAKRMWRRGSLLPKSSPGVAATPASASNLSARILLSGPSWLLSA
jgi:hypothetical protein